MGAFYSVCYTDIHCTRKRITAHSGGLPFLGARLARVALAHASAVGERAQVARAHSEI